VLKQEICCSLWKDAISWTASGTVANFRQWSLIYDPVFKQAGIM
jgi:hypothetical protein